MTMFRLGTALLLATLMTTGALARGGGMGMARGGFSQPMLPAPPIDNSTPTLTGPVGPPLRVYLGGITRWKPLPEIIDEQPVALWRRGVPTVQYTSIDDRCRTFRLRTPSVIATMLAMGTRKSWCPSGLE